MPMQPDEDWRPEPEPQNALERLIEKAADDPTLQGKMFRLLLESELCIYVPPHPELIGEHIGNIDDGFTWCAFEDAEGAFAAVFTSMACAEYEMRNLNSQEPRPMVCEMPAQVLFAFLNDGNTTVRVMASGGATLKLKAEAVALLVAGKFTHHRVPTGDEGKRKVSLYPVPDEKVPMKLREAIDDFCTQRCVPIAVYVFHQADPVTGEVTGNDLRVILWLRRADNDFYNDFCLMGQKLTPTHLEFCCGVVLSEDRQAVTFLQQQKPLWPVLAAG